MKVLFVHHVGGAFGHITDSMIRCLRSVGHIVARWDGKLESWQQFNPDLYIGCSGHKQPIPVRRNCKVAIHVNPYGPVAINGINENADNIKWVVSQYPDIVFGYGQETDRLLWSYWESKHQIKWQPLPTAGDRIIFKQTTDLDKRSHDLVYLGGYWAYKGATIDRFLVPVLKDPIFSKAVYGWGDWPYRLSAGVLAEDAVTATLNSGRVGPCISEIHTHSHGIDIPERAFKLALCGTLIVHDAVPVLRQMIPSAVICPTPEHFRSMCLHYKNNDAERIELVRKQQQEVLSGHTYHHRLAGLFTALGWSTEAQALLNYGFTN